MIISMSKRHHPEARRPVFVRQHPSERCQGCSSKIADPLISSHRPNTKSRESRNSGRLPSARGSTFKSKFPCVLTISTKVVINAEGERRSPEISFRFYPKESPMPRITFQVSGLIFRYFPYFGVRKSAWMPTGSSISFHITSS